MHFPNDEANGDAYSEEIDSRTREREEVAGLLDAARRAGSEKGFSSLHEASIEEIVQGFCVRFEPHELKKEGVQILRLSLPASAMNVLSFAITTLSVLFVGRVSTLDLSGVLLANSIFNVTGTSLVVGLASGMETLCSQAFGAGQYLLVGVILQRALLLVTILCAAISLAWIGCFPFLVWTGQEVDVARIAARCMFYLTPGLFGVSLFFCLKTYLAMQSIVLPSMYVSAFGAILSVSSNYVLVLVLDLGAVGSAISTSITFIAEGLLLAWYVCWRHSSTRESVECTWQGWTKDALNGWIQYLIVAVPSAAMLCLEWWVFEIAVALAGLLDNPEVSVAAFGIGYQMLTLSFAVPYGLSTAASTRVGTFLGKGQARKTVCSVHTSLALTLVHQVVLSLTVFSLRNSVGFFFTSDEVVAKAVSGVIPLVALAILGDGFNATMSGVLRGAGRQKIGFFINLGVFYFLALPLSLALGFRLGYGINGLWFGLLTGLLVQPACLLGVMLSLNWKAEARRALEVVTLQGNSTELNGGVGELELDWMDRSMQ